MNSSRRARVGALLVFTIGMAAVAPPGVRGAMEVVVTASPAHAMVGQPVEIQIRTFLPLAASQLSLDVAAARTPFPASSGYWSLLYAFAADYPFRVEARGPRGESASVVVTRDPGDASLYRGVARLPSPGRWRIQVLNYLAEAPGTSADVDVEPAPAAAGAVPGAQQSEEAVAGSFLLGILAGLAFGFLAGLTFRIRVGRTRHTAIVDGS